MTGSIVTFDDAIPFMPIEKIVAYLEPQQDLHGYDAPWPAGGGKNLLDPDKRTIYASGQGQRWYESEGFTLKANQAYTFSVTYANPIALYIRDKATGDALANGNIAITYTPTEDTAVYFQAYRSEDISSVDTFQLELGSTASAWSPYANVCPISGWTGVQGQRTGANLFDKSTATVGKFINGSGAEQNNANLAHSVIIPVTPSTTYYMSGYGGAGIYSILALDEDKTVISTWYGGASKTDAFTATVPNNCHFVYLNFMASQIDTVMFCKSNSASPYEPYTGEPISVSWQDEAGTVYGGTLDVVNGVLTAEVGKYIVTGTEEVQAQNGYFRLFRAISGAKEDATKTICSDYPVASTFSRTTMYLAVNASGQGTVYFPLDESSRFADATAFKEYLASRYQANNPVEIIYPLAEPVVYQLTPQQIETLLGQNNIWVDTGDVSVTYQSTSGSTPVRTSFKSPLINYSYSSLKLFNDTFIEHGKG